MSTSVAVIVFEGFDEMDAIGPYEVLSTAMEYGADLRLSLCTLDAVDSVQAAHGLCIEPDHSLDSFDPDVAVVPGGGWTSRRDDGVRAELASGRLPDAIATQHEAGTTVASVCTGGLLLAEAGLLDGRPAVTHEVALDDLRDRGADVVNARIVDDGDIVTAGGITAGIDLGLWLVERFVDGQCADDVAAHLEYERTDDVHERY